MSRFLTPVDIGRGNVRASQWSQSVRGRVVSVDICRVAIMEQLVDLGKNRRPGDRAELVLELLVR